MITDHHDWCNSSSGRAYAVPCCFGDIMQFLFGLDPNLSSMTFQQKRNHIFNECGLTQTQYCFSHNMPFFVQEPTCVEVAGLPCPDNSRANAARAYEEGASSGIYCAWAKRHRHLKTPLVIIENVPDSCT